MNKTEQIGCNVINYIVKGNLVRAEHNTCVWSANAAEQIGEFVLEQARPRILFGPDCPEETVTRFKNNIGYVIIHEPEPEPVKEPSFWRKLFRKGGYR